MIGNPIYGKSNPNHQPGPIVTIPKKSVEPTIWRFPGMGVWIVGYPNYCSFFKVTFSTINSRSLSPQKGHKKPPQMGHFEEPGIYPSFVSIYIYSIHGSVMGYNS